LLHLPITELHTNTSVIIDSTDAERVLMTSAKLKLVRGIASRIFNTFISTLVFNDEIIDSITSYGHYEDNLLTVCDSFLLQRRYILSVQVIPHTALYSVQKLQI
jgi:hypothetical protein